jgi:hypothetical protein
LIDILLLDIGQEQRGPHGKAVRLGDVRESLSDRQRSFAHRGGHQGERNIVVIVNAQTDLLQIAFAAHAAGRFAGLLHCRQQERDEDADDRNHHQQLDQCKARAQRASTNAARHRQPQSPMEREWPENQMQQNYPYYDARRRPCHGGIRKLDKLCQQPSVVEAPTAGSC